MESIQKMQKLLSENETLCLQLEENIRTIRKKDNEISLLNDMSETAASLQSRIDNNLLEIEQLKYNSKEDAQKAAAIERLNEELGINLLKEIKERQKSEAVIKQMGTIKANLSAVNEELDEATSLYGKLSLLMDELAEVKSFSAGLEEENAALKAEISSLRLLVKSLENKKLSNT